MVLLNVHPHSAGIGLMRDWGARKMTRIIMAIIRSSPKNKIGVAAFCVRIRFCEHRTTATWFGIGIGTYLDGHIAELIGCGQLF